jgi:hypothetical protein
MLGSKRILSLIAMVSAVTIAAGCTGFFVNPTLTSLAVGPQSQTITANPTQTLQMSATGTYNDGSTKDLTAKVSWSSATTNCATVGSGGLVTPVKTISGVCTSQISASFGTVSPATTSVTVSEGTPTQIVLTANPTNPIANSMVTFKALATFSGSNTQQDITASVTWTNTDTTDLTLTNGSTTGTISASARSGTAINVTAAFSSVNSNTVTLTVQ